MGLQEEKEIDGKSKGQDSSIYPRCELRVLNTSDYWKNQGCSEREREREAARITDQKPVD